MRTWLAAAMLCVGGWVHAAEPTDADWDWLDQNRTPAFDSLMPLTAPTGETVSYRSYRDLHHDRLERYVQIRSVPGSPLEAVVVRPVRESVQVQLLRLHMETPTASLHDQLPSVRIERLVVEGKECAAAGQQLDALYSLQFRVPTRELLIIHPEIHHISMRLLAGDLEATLVETDHPLVKWALATEARIHECGVSGKRGQ